MAVVVAVVRAVKAVNVTSTHTLFIHSQLFCVTSLTSLLSPFSSSVFLLTWQFCSCPSLWFSVFFLLFQQFSRWQVRWHGFYWALLAGQFNLRSGFLSIRGKVKSKLKYHFKLYLTEIYVLRFSVNLILINLLLPVQIFHLPCTKLISGNCSKWMNNLSSCAASLCVQ